MISHLCTALLAVLSLHLEATVAECECGKNNLDNRIVGGNESLVHEWPWQVGFVAYINESFPEVQFCGGSLISPSWVLTAAHCFVNDFLKDQFGYYWFLRNSYVLIGDYALHNGFGKSYTKSRGISQIIVHNDYRLWDVILQSNKQRVHLFVNDIAVIKLAHPVEYSHGIRPVCLPTNLRTQLFVGEHATASGWGLKSNNGTDTNIVLDVTLPIISNTECEDMFPSEDEIKQLKLRDDQLCTYDEGKNICKGDSGGPLVWLDDGGHYQQIGIVSFGKLNGCAGKDRPGIYTRVTSYIDWIEEKTNTHFCYP